jgi:hypothetical protein
LEKSHNESLTLCDVLFCIQHAPYRATTVGGAVVNGMTMAMEPLNASAGETLDTRVDAAMGDVYDEIRRCVGSRAGHGLVTSHSPWLLTPPP